MAKVEPINSELRVHQATVRWAHSERLALYHRFFDVLNARCFAEQPLPFPAISIEPSRTRVELGYYMGCRDGFGFCDRINISAHAAAEKSTLIQLSILAHEMCHQWERLYAEPPKSNWYHGRVFCEQARTIGVIAARGRGHTLGLADPFLSICRELGVNDLPPTFQTAAGTRDEQRGEPAAAHGKSTLTKWTCRCAPPVNIWVGRASVTVRCEQCDARFARWDVKG